MNDLTLQYICITGGNRVECECPMCGEDLEYQFSEEDIAMCGGDAGLAATERWEQELCGIDH